MRNFSERDLSGNGSLYWIRGASVAEMVFAPLRFHRAGLQETVSGFGARLTTPHKIQFNGRLYRIYCTCYSNAGSCWFTAGGRKIYVG